MKSLKNVGNVDIPSLDPVSPGGGRLRFFSACSVAALLAVTVKAVCGTRRGIRGMRRRPSICHSELTSGPAMLPNKGNMVCFMVVKHQASSFQAAEVITCCCGSLSSSVLPLISTFLVFKKKSDSFEQHFKLLFSPTGTFSLFSLCSEDPERAYSLLTKGQKPLYGLSPDLPM